MGAGEPIDVTSKVVSSMSDCILARLGDHSEIEVSLHEEQRLTAKHR